MKAAGKDQLVSLDELLKALDAKKGTPAAGVIE